MTLALGHRSVAEAQRSISSREFSEWLAFNRHHPIGMERGDWHAALIAQKIANLFRSESEQLKVKELLLDWGAEPERETPEQIEAKMMQWARMTSKARKRKTGK